MMTDVAVVDVAAAVIAAAVFVLAGALAAAAMRIRKAAIQSERLLSRLNDELPELLRELRRTHYNIRAVTDQARDGVERASVLLHALGDVGQTVNRVHDVLCGQGSFLTRVLAGMRAVALTVKDRVNKEEGGERDGKQ